ncbi:MAG: TonB family protein [Syntrophaceae bacterium]|nr:TonB family protein [Syntrophaceae bacterium]
MVGILNNRNSFRSAVLASAILHAVVIAAVLATAVNTAPRLLTGDGDGILHVSLVSGPGTGGEHAAPVSARPPRQVPVRELSMPAAAVQETRPETVTREEGRIELASVGIPEAGMLSAKASRAGAETAGGGSAASTAAGGSPSGVGDSKGGDVTIAWPRYGENARPHYPEAARMRGYEGVVLLSAEVRADGRVGEVRILKSCGYDMLDRSALDAVRRWKFEPGRRMGVPVAMWVDVPVRFVLRD